MISRVSGVRRMKVACQGDRVAKATEFRYVYRTSGRGTSSRVSSKTPARSIRQSEFLDYVILRRQVCHTDICRKDGDYKEEAAWLCCTTIGCRSFPNAMGPWKLRCASLASLHLWLTCANSAVLARTDIRSWLSASSNHWSPNTTIGYPGSADFLNSTERWTLFSAPTYSAVITPGTEADVAKVVCNRLLCGCFAYFLADPTAGQFGECTPRPFPGHSRSSWLYHYARSTRRWLSY